MFAKQKKNYFKYILVVLALFIVGYGSHYLTVSFYKDIDDAVIRHLGNQINEDLENIDINRDKLIQKFSQLEKEHGIEYVHENIPLDKRFDKLAEKMKEEKKFEDRIQSHKFTIKDKVRDSIPLGKPLDKIIITSKYGKRFHPIHKKWKFHRGVDLRAKVNSNVYATSSGFVRYVQNHRDGYGKAVYVQHNFGFETRYAHLSKILVKNGDYVEKGEAIALSGNSGDSTAPHLHYEVRFGGIHITPRMIN